MAQHCRDSGIEQWVMHRDLAARQWPGASDKTERTGADARRRTIVRQFHDGQIAFGPRIGRDDPHDGVLCGLLLDLDDQGRSEEHTSELQSLMSISYAVLCL